MINSRPPFVFDSEDRATIKSLIDFLNDEIVKINARRGANKADKKPTPKMVVYAKQIQFLEENVGADTNEELQHYIEIIESSLKKIDSKYKQTVKARRRKEEMLETEEGDAMRAKWAENAPKAQKKYQENTSQEEIRKARKRGGRRGGPARSESLTAEQRSEIAKKAARARWEKESNTTIDK